MVSRANPMAALLFFLSISLAFAADSLESECARLLRIYETTDDPVLRELLERDIARISRDVTPDTELATSAQMEQSTTGLEPVVSDASITDERADQILRGQASLDWIQAHEFLSQIEFEDLAFSFLSLMNEQEIQEFGERRGLSVQQAFLGLLFVNANLAAFRNHPLIKGRLPEQASRLFNLNDGRIRLNNVLVSIRHPEVVLALIRAGLDVTRVHSLNHPPLTIAIRLSYNDIALELIERGAKLTLSQIELRSLQYGTSLEVVQKLGELGADFHFRTDQNETILFRPLNKPVLEYLLSKGVNIHAKNIKGDTALTHAIRNAYSHTSHALVDLGAIETTDEWVKKKALKLTKERLETSDAIFNRQIWKAWHDLYQRLRD